MAFLPNHKKPEHHLHLDRVRTLLLMLSLPLCNEVFGQDPASATSTVQPTTSWPKKVLEYGWDTQTPAFIAEHIREMEKRPFDGLIFRLAAGADVLDPKPWDDARFAADLAAIPRIQWKNFTDNFVIMLAASNQQWENDEQWTNILKHAQQITQAARLAKCVGICFDAEPYGENPWAYKKGSVKDTRQFEAFEAMVRRRGTQFMQAIESEIPSPKVLLFYTFSIFQNLCQPMEYAARKERLARNANGLLPAFIEGMLLAANAGAEIIDGNEEAYYYYDSARYFDIYHGVTQRARYMVTPEVWSAYQEHYRMGQALYIDQYYGLRQERTLGDYMLAEERPKWMEHNTYWALYTADRYVWCYSERMNWWVNNDVPPGCEDAVRSARAKVNAGEKLGFSLEPLVNAAQQRKTAALEAARYERMPKRTAEIVPATEPPDVDGVLSKPFWQGTAPLEPFVGAGTPDGNPKANTIARAAYDSKAIYVSVSCQKPGSAEKLPANDRAIFDGDVVEVLLNPTRSDSMFYHFAINPSGAYWAGHYVKDKPEPLAQAWGHAAKVEQNTWTAEFAMPWGLIGLSGPPMPSTNSPDMYNPRPAPPVRVNIGRRKSGETSSWSPVARTMLEPGNFGTWKFKSSR